MLSFTYGVHVFHYVCAASQYKGRSVGARDVHGLQPLGRWEHGDGGRVARRDEPHAACGAFRASAELRSWALTVPRAALQNLRQSRNSVHYR